MKKYLFCILPLTLSLFAACAAQSTPIEEALSLETESILPSTSAPTLTEQPVSTTEPEPLVIETDYYTLTVPASWEESCYYEITPGEGYGYTVSFSEKQDHDTFGGGFLFSLALYTEDMDYTVLPSYQVLGSLEVYRLNGFNLVAVFPTDVQFTEETAQLYSEMEAQIPEIFNSITMKEECSFSSEPIPIYIPESSAPIITGSFLGRWDCWTLMSSSLPDGASNWIVEFNEDGTGAFQFEYEPGDYSYLEFNYTTYETPYMEGIQILLDGSPDTRFLIHVDWSNQQQNMIMAMYIVEEGTLYEFNNDTCWIFNYV